MTSLLPEATDKLTGGWRFLPVLAIGLLVVTVGATLAVAGSTLGYDFLAYHAAAARALGGQPAYDTSFAAAGGFGLFYYPPTFIPLVLALGALPATAATWAWTALLLASFDIGVAAMPVSLRTRWITVLLAAQSWPFLYAIKLGQVGPLLFLLFALGWRWVDSRPAAVGVTAALGAAIKLQPGLLLAWALLTRRWIAVVAGGATLLLLAVLATGAAGLQAWTDFAVLIRRVSDPITTPHNVTPGAVAYGLGLQNEAALVQWLSMGLALVAVTVAALRLPSAPSYLVAVIASQLLSPILWDHYAMLLLLPVAWMLDRRAWWAVGAVLATSVFLVAVIPAWIYPAAFWFCLLGVIALSMARAGDREATHTVSMTSAT